jgi:hypothetical protein
MWCDSRDGSNDSRDSRRDMADVDDFNERTEKVGTRRFNQQHYAQLFRNSTMGIAFLLLMLVSISLSLIVLASHKFSEVEFLGSSRKENEMAAFFS